MAGMIEKFKKKQKKTIFWHNYLVNDWKELISDQFETLYKSGLYDAVDKVCCGVVGIQPCLDEYSVFIKELVSSYTTNNKIEIRTSIENSFEYITLNWLKEYCNSNDAYVLYFHIKGISHPIGSITRPFEDDWRKYLEYFNIEKWQDCIKKLDEKFDCCGIGYRKRKKFIGNFWWANSNYIKKLIPVSNVLLNKDKRIVALRRRRYFYENWLFKYNPNKWTTFTPNIYCFYSRVGIYKGQRRLSPEEYRDK
jgi:hypothetical protein